MRKNKGYQLDIYKSWHRKEGKLSWAGGENKTPEQILEEANARFDERIETCKRQYEKISTRTTLEGKDLYKYCREYSIWEIRFNVDYNKNEYTLIPLDKTLEMIEEDRRKTIGRHLYGKWNGYQKRIIHKDNQKFVYNTGSGPDGSRNRVRIPSLKRSKATWKRFYELFPYYKENYNELVKEKGLKLKKVW